jgi:hypothetical protein
MAGLPESPYVTRPSIVLAGCKSGLIAMISSASRLRLNHHPTDSDTITVTSNTSRIEKRNRALIAGSFCRS